MPTRDISFEYDYVSRQDRGQPELDHSRISSLKSLPDIIVSDEVDEAHNIIARSLRISVKPKHEML